MTSENPWKNISYHISRNSQEKYQLDEDDFEAAAAGVDGRLFIRGGPDERKLVCLRPATPPLSSSIISLLA